MTRPRIRSPILRRLTDTASIRRELGVISREAVLLRSLLRLSERMQRHIELIQAANPPTKEPNP